MNFPKAFKKSIKVSEPLDKHTTFKIGGKALYWLEPKNLVELINFLKNRNTSLPVFVVGAGSNLLIRQGLIRKIFIHLSGHDFNFINLKKNILSVGSGVRIGSLISFLASRNVGGYEFLAGIPGTVGGALVMNAGSRSEWHDLASYREMKDIVCEVLAIDYNGNIHRLSAKDCKFAYRSSNLRSFIVLGAKLRLKKADKNMIGNRIKQNIRERIRNQDWYYPSAGSFFKNPSSGEAAGSLIDQCHLKGASVGGAQVSEKHANFIINRNKAKSSDVIKLMEIIQKKVYNRFKIILEPEVEFIS